MSQPIAMFVHSQGTAPRNEGTEREASHGAVPDGQPIRPREGFYDLRFPPVPLPASNAADPAGEALLRKLVERHHERLRDSCLSNLFPINGERFARSVDRAAAFVVEACGGPRPMAGDEKEASLRARHFHIAIDETAREVWLAELLLAFDDVGFPRSRRASLWNWLEALSVRMINRRTTLAQPTRYPYSTAAERLRPFMATRRRPVVCPR
jgi:hemoglobin